MNQAQGVMILPNGDIITATELDSLVLDNIGRNAFLGNMIRRMAETQKMEELVIKEKYAKMVQRVPVAMEGTTIPVIGSGLRPIRKMQQRFV